MAAVKEGERVAAIAKDLEWYIADVDLADNISDLGKAAKTITDKASNTGILLLTAGKKNLLALAIVPESRKSVVSAKEILDAALTDFSVETKELPSGGVLGTVKADEEKNVFPIKVKDTARANASAFMQKKGCFGEDDSSDDEVAFGDDDTF